jgi:hypothetical protein
LDWGSVGKFLQKRAEKGKDTPAWDDRPQLDEALEYIWNCFWQMQCQRQCGFAANALAFQDIMAFADFYGIDSYEQRDEFYQGVSLLDSHWLKLTAKQEK